MTHLKISKVRTLFLIFGMLGFAAQVQAKWISSGGELFRFDKNPWFLSNTSNVTYCLSVDQKSVSVASDVVLSNFDEALNFWKKELSIEDIRSEDSFTPLATQNFIFEKECTPQTDLKVIAGYAELNDEQIEFLKEPESFVGVSVRTEYDQIAMRAKGFIYISSDLGAHSYRNEGHLVEKAWSYPNLLKNAFIHELGHVFGVAHVGNGLMSETFMDELLHKKFHKLYSAGLQPAFTKIADKIELSSINSVIDHSFFGDDLAASKIVLRSNLDRSQWQVFKIVGEEEIEVGHLKIVGSLVHSLGRKPLITIQLPPEQNVFTEKETLLGNYLYGAIESTYSGRGIYFRTGSPKPYNVQVSLSRESLQILTAEGGKIQEALRYTAPLLLQKLIPIEVD